MTPTERKTALVDCLCELDAAKSHLKRARELARRAGIRNTGIPKPSTVADSMQRIAAFMQGGVER